MIRPIPFCPSFDPCAKLTPVQVSTSRARIQKGGGSVPTGASYNFRFLTTAFMAKSKRPATTNPTIGESRSDLPMFRAWAQSTPLVPLLADMSWLAIPTPMMEPIRVCELDAGNPKYQVLRFQMMAATRRANTMANPALLPTCRISSTGNREMIPNATRPDEVSTPIKFQKPDQTTATWGSREWVQITVATALA